MSATSTTEQQMQKAVDAYHIVFGLAFKMTSTDRVVFHVRLFDKSHEQGTQERFIEFETTVLLTKEESRQITLPVISSIQQRQRWEQGSRLQPDIEGEFTMYLANVDGARKFKMTWRPHDGYNYIFDSPYGNQTSDNCWLFCPTGLPSITHALTMTGHEWRRHLDMQEILTNEATKARIPLAMQMVKDLVLDK